VLLGGRHPASRGAIALPPSCSARRIPAPNSRGHHRGGTDLRPRHRSALIEGAHGEENSIKALQELNKPLELHVRDTLDWILWLSWSGLDLIAVEV
jgi:hypothetical protein